MARDGIADFAYVNPGLSAWPLPDHRRRRNAVPVRQRQGRHGGARRLVSQIRRAGDEGRALLLRLRLRSRHLPLARKKIVLPERHQGHEGAAGQRTIGAFVTMLGGTNVQASAPEAREMLERGVADAITFPWGSIILFGIDKVVKYHMDMPLVHDDLRLGDEQGQVRRACRRRRRR